MKLDDLNDILTPDDLFEILPFGRSKVYSLLKSGEIKSKQCGSQYIVLKDALFEYLGKLPCATEQI